MYVKFASSPPEEQLRRVLGPKLPGGVAELQEVRGTNEVIVGTEVQDEKKLDSARKTIIDTLSETFNQGQGNRVDINNSNATALAERLRGPLQSAGVSLSEEQLQATMKAITTFRDTPPRSGLITNLDQLSGVNGVTPKMISVMFGVSLEDPIT